MPLRRGQGSSVSWRWEGGALPASSNPPCGALAAGISKHVYIASASYAGRLIARL